MVRKWQIGIALLAVLAGAGVIYAYPLFVSSNTAEVRTVTIGYGTGNNYNLLPYYAAELGFLTEVGLNHTLVLLSQGTLVPALISGEVDFVVTAAQIAVLGKTAGQLKIVAGGSDYLDSLFKAPPLYVNPDKVGSVYDLAGKSLAVVQLGDGVQALYTKTLTLYAVDTQTITWVPVGRDFLPALENSIVDATFITDPFSQARAEQRGFVILTDPNGERITSATSNLGRGLNPPQFVALTTTKMVQEDPDLVERVVRAWVKTKAWANDPANFDRLVELTVKFFQNKVSTDLLRRYMFDEPGRTISGNLVTERMYQDLLRVLVESGLVDANNAPTYEDAVDMKFVQKVQPSS